MFYRKYRPQKFSEISKPNDVAVALANQVAAGKVEHAYLFIGPRGTGKTTTARILTKAINCEHLKDGDPCGKCKTCEAIREGKFFDLVEIDAASNRGIDDIRSLKERVNMSPMAAKRKVYIIDEVHMLTMEAFNALLKTLEEPPAHVVFILCTTESHKVPETIKSRCQVFKFKRATRKQIVERLEDICSKEKVKVAKEDLEKIAAASLGGFRDADTLLQQIVEGSMTASALLGAGGANSYVKITDCILKGKTQEALTLLSAVFNEGADLTNWTNEYIQYLRDLLYLQAGFESGNLDVTQETFAKMEEQAFKISSKELVLIIEQFMRAVTEIKSTAIPQLPLELLIVGVCEQGQSDKVKSEAILETSDAKSPEVSGVISFDSILEKWSVIIKEVKPYNHSVEALLRSCKPKFLKDNALTLEVAYAFHKERLESPKSKEILEKVIAEMFGSRIKIKCVLKSPDGAALTDKNVVAPAPDSPAPKALDVFDGELVL